MESRKLFVAINYAKFFFAICIVALHSGVYEVLPCSYYIEKLILRLAVPFFFVSTGFFREKSREKGKDFSAFAKRLAVPLLFFEVINCTLEIITIMISGGGALGKRRINH